MSTATLDKNDSAGPVDSAENSASHLITLTLRIRRFNPEISEDAQWQDFTLEIDPKDRVLSTRSTRSSGNRTAPSPSAAPAPTASAARTPCGSTGAIGSPARRC